MKLSNGKYWKVFLPSSIILLTSLLAASYFARIIPGAAVIETVNVEPTTWSMVKPYYATGVGQSIERLCNSASVNVNFTVCVSQFIPVSLEGWGSGQTLMTVVSLYTTVLGGYVQYVNLWFNWSRVNDTSTVYVDQQIADYSPLLQNLTLTGVDEKDTHNAAVTTVAEPNCSSCCVRGRVYWLLKTEDVRDHQLNYTAEVVYQDANNTLWRVNVPINVVLFQHYNSDFNTAQEIGLGTYDPVPFRIIMPAESDYYKFKVEPGKSYSITATPAGKFFPYYSGGPLNLYLYDETHGLLTSFSRAPPCTIAPVEASIGPMSYSGYVYARVECAGGLNPYSLTVNQAESS